MALVHGGLGERDSALRELRIMHQRTVIATSVEEAIAKVLTMNTTLLKLGLVVRNDVPRRRIEAALTRNVDQQRQLRLVSIGTTWKKAAAAAAAATDAPRKRALSTQFYEVAQTLNDKLKPFDHAAVAEAVRSNSTPSPRGSREFNVNNDTKFAKLSEGQIVELIEAFRQNSTATRVEMANLGLGDIAAKTWASVLSANPHITALNLEGNRIGPDGFGALTAALLAGSELVELKLDHQLGPVLPAQAELRLAQAVELTKLTKLTFHMRNVQSRDLVFRGLMRNRDAAGRLSRISRRADGGGELTAQEVAAKEAAARELAAREAAAREASLKYAAEREAAVQQEAAREAAAKEVAAKEAAAEEAAERAAAEREAAKERRREAAVRESVAREAAEREAAEGEAAVREAAEREASQEAAVRQAAARATRQAAAMTSYVLPKKAAPATELPVRVGARVETYVSRASGVGLWAHRVKFEYHVA